MITTKTVWLCVLLYVLTVWLNPARSQTAKADSTPRSTGLDTTLSYRAQTVHNWVDARRTLLQGQAVIRYKDMTLEAHRITVDWDRNLIVAKSGVDSIWVYKEGHQDSVKVAKVIGTPVLTQAGTVMRGDGMEYNYRTEKGRVVRGRTSLDEGYYRGDQIKLVDKNTLNVTESRFTTCDLDTSPHFHFHANRLILINNEQVLAKPIVMYIGHIPVAALPFVVFPTRRGRHSGLLIPRYGQSFREGRYLRGLGYYWAPNEYFDAKAMVDFYEKAGWMFRGGINYAIRYRLRGSISGSLTRKNFQSLYQPDYTERRWDLRINHSQTLSPTSRLSASGFFVSDNSFYKDVSRDLNTRLTQELRSNATYTKSWPSRKLSLSVNMSRTQNLQTDRVSETLPRVSFRKGQSQLFAPEDGRPEERRRLSETDDRWYHYLYYSYNSRFRHLRRDVLSTSPGADLTTERELDMQHTLSLSMSSPRKVFGWLGLNQSLSIDEDWFSRTQRYRWDEESGSVVSEDVDGFDARHTFRYNAQATTKLYGLFAPGIGNIQAVRHVVTPSISFQYQPDFSDSFWGYYQDIRSPDGDIIQRDRFGGTPSRGTRSLRFNMANLFQMKVGSGEETRKLDLFSMDVSTGYNLEADQYRASDLVTSWRANPARNFSLSASTSHSFYRWDRGKSQRVNDYLFDAGGWARGAFLRFTSMRFNVSLRLQGEGKTGSGQNQRRDTAVDETTGLDGEEVPVEELSVLEENLDAEENRFDEKEGVRYLDIPWRLNMTFNVSLNRNNPERPVKRYYMNVSGMEVQLTSNWRIGYNAQYDLNERKIAYHQLTIYRDLHCWEARLNWVPSGLNPRLYFRINIKSSLLEDIKLEKHGGAGGVLGY